MFNTTNKRLISILAGALVCFGTVVIAKIFVIPKSETGVLGTEVIQPIPAAEQASYSLNSGAYKAKDVTVISNFESSEKDVWQGSGVIDEKIYYEGARSMALISVDRKAVTVTLEKTLNLTNMKRVEFMLHVTDAEAFESVIMDFGDLDLKSYYRYTLSNLKNGWNLIRIPKEDFILAKANDSTFDWPSVVKVRFYTLSRPGSIFLVRLDMLRSVNYPEDFLGQWRSNQPEMFFSLYEQAKKIKLLARGIGANTAILKNIEDMNNFDFSVSVSPQSAARSGLFVRGDYVKDYGYYFLLGGDKKNNWQILKKNKDGWTPAEKIIKGGLDNVVFAKDKEYWLRIKGKDNLLEFYFSTDGSQYEKLGQLDDGEFRGGGVGIAVPDAGWSLFDNFSFNKI